jgi:two-component system phosphate regulon response regulator PhoB
MQSSWNCLILAAYRLIGNSIMPSTILVVEDEPAIQELVAVNLTFAGHKVLRAAAADHAMTLVRAELPDLILLDWMLPDMSGIVFAKRLRADERTRDVPIIMLTARSNEGDKVEGLEAGADDYITKPFSPKELIARIKAVLRRRAPQLTDDLVEIGGLKLDPATHRLSGARPGATPQSLDIGPTEFRLLHFFMTHPERVYSRAQLLDQVWGDHVFLEERTVDVHIRRLRHALTPSGHDVLVETVRGSGYRFCATTPRDVERDLANLAV